MTKRELLKRKIDALSEVDLSEALDRIDIMDSRHRTPRIDAFDEEVFSTPSKALKTAGRTATLNRH